MTFAFCFSIITDGDEVFTHQYPFLSSDNHMGGVTRGGDSSFRVR